MRTSLRRRACHSKKSDGIPLARINPGALAETEECLWLDIIDYCECIERGHGRDKTDKREGVSSQLEPNDALIRTSRRLPANSRPSDKLIRNRQKILWLTLG